MTRNMIKRVEILFPVEDKEIGKRLVDFMNLQLSDNQKDVIKISMVISLRSKRFISIKFTSLLDERSS